MNTPPKVQLTQADVDALMCKLPDPDCERCNGFGLVTIHGGGSGDKSANAAPAQPAAPAPQPADAVKGALKGTKI